MTSRTSTARSDSTSCNRRPRHGPGDCGADGDCGPGRRRAGLRLPAGGASALLLESPPVLGEHLGRRGGGDHRAELRYDTSLLLRADINFCLQSLMLDRFVLVDGRYSFIHIRFAGGGGNARQRSSERHAAEIAYLKRKWGPYLEAVDAKGTVRIVVKVDR